LDRGALIAMGDEEPRRDRDELAPRGLPLLDLPAHAPTLDIPTVGLYSETDRRSVSISSAAPPDQNAREECMYATTPFGEISYRERGSGPAALFVHGVFLNGHLWRHVIDRVADIRRCIAVDLLAHGATRTRPDQDVSFDAQAGMLRALCDRLGLDQVDILSNDS